MRTFQKSSTEISNSIIPVLTKVKPDDPEFDYEVFQSDMTEIMDNNLDLYLKQMQNSAVDSEAQSKITEEDIQQFEENKSRDQIEPHKLPILKDYCERKKFFDSFVSRMVICDPLDRIGDPNRGGNPELYPATNHQKALKVEELKEALFGTQTFQGGEQLQVSLPSEMYYKLKEIIENERNQIKELAENNYLEIAKEYGDLTCDKFGDFPRVKSLLQTLKFFDEENLLNFIKEEIVDYEDFINNVNKIGESHKKEGSTIDEKICIHDFESLILRRSQKNYVSVVRILYEILEKIANKYKFLENKTDQNEIE